MCLEKVFYAIFEHDFMTYNLYQALKIKNTY